MPSKAIRRSPDWLAQHQVKLGARRTGAPFQAAVAPAPGVDVARLVRQDAARKRFQALGRLPKDQMNDTEAEYAELLEQRRMQGLVLWWKFHPMNVRLAARTFYEVDFLVMGADGLLEIHEIKGAHTTEKGQMKIKLCAEALPVCRFFKMTKLPKKDGGGWQKEEF